MSTLLLYNTDIVQRSELVSVIALRPSIATMLYTHEKSTELDETKDKKNRKG